MLRSFLIFSLFGTAHVLFGQFGPENRFVHPVNHIWENDDPPDQITFDVDQDGDMDIVKTTKYGVYIHHQIAPREFRVESRITSMTNCNFLAAKDVDGDGLDDIVAQRSDSAEIVWARSLGGGNFDQELILVSGLTGLREFQMEDLNGDAILDIIYAQGSSPVILRWKLGLGGASFAPAVDILSGINNYTSRPAQPRFGLADMDNDNDLDLVANTTGSELLCAFNDGSGTFLIDTLASTLFQRIADLDSDGDNDILVQNNALEWLENLGNGTFAQNQLGTIIAGGFFYSVNAADFDGDGDTDIFYHSAGDQVLSDKVRLCKNDGAMNFSCNDIWLSDNAHSQKKVYLDADSFPDILGYSSSSFYAHYDEEDILRIGSVITPDRLTFGDVDLNGYLDILVGAADQGGSSIEGDLPLGVALHLNDGGQVSEMAQELAFAKYDWQGNSYSYPNDERLYDEDNDGDLDLQVRNASEISPSSSAFWSSRENDGMGNFLTENNGAYENQPFFYVGGEFLPLSTDLDMDGGVDLYSFSNSYWLGPQLFVGGNSYRTNQWISHITAIDMDGDGDRDILIQSYTDSVFWHENVGSLLFAPMAFLWEVETYYIQPFRYTFDMNNDGKEDLLSYGPNGHTPLLNNGVGFDTLAPFTTYFNLLDDVDADGWPDMLAIHSNGNVLFYKNMQDSTFGDSMVIGHIEGLGGQVSTTDVKLADLDNDGVRDLVYVNSRGAVGWLKNNFQAQLQEVKISPVIFLEGPFDSSSGLMNDDMRTAGYIPAIEPFTALGYNFVGGGGETIDANVLAETGTNAIVDWSVLELRDKNNSSIVQFSRAVLVQRDGDVVDIDGISAISLDLGDDDYFIALRHRNHLGVMSLSTVNLGGTSTTVDFSDPATSTYGVDAQKNVNGTMVMCMGDVNFSGVIKYVGADNDRDAILVIIGGIAPTATTSGYLGEDTNLDGTVKYTGLNNDRDPILINIGGVVPTNTKVEQLP